FAGKAPDLVRGNLHLAPTKTPVASYSHPSHPLPPSRTVRSFRQHFLICKILCCLFRYATELTKVNFLLFKIHKMMFQKPKCILSDLNDRNPAENRSCSQPDHTAVRGLGLPATATGKHAKGAETPEVPLQQFT